MLDSVDKSSIKPTRLKDINTDNYKMFTLEKIGATPWAEAYKITDYAGTDLCDDTEIWVLISTGDGIIPICDCTGYCDCYEYAAPLVVDDGDEIGIFEVCNRAYGYVLKAYYYSRYQAERTLSIFLYDYEEVKSTRTQTS